MDDTTRPIAIQALLTIALRSARASAGLEEAMAAYERGDYLDAETLLLVAGHAGHPNAQEMLGFMYAIGPDRFPGIWRSLEAARNWFGRASHGGRPGAKYMEAAFSSRGVLQVRADIMASFHPAAPVGVALR